MPLGELLFTLDQQLFVKQNWCFKAIFFSVDPYDNFVFRAPCRLYIVHVVSRTIKEMLNLWNYFYHCSKNHIQIYYIFPCLLKDTKNYLTSSWCHRSILRALITALEAICPILGTQVWFFKCLCLLFVDFILFPFYWLLTLPLVIFTYPLWLFAYN